MPRCARCGASHEGPCPSGDQTALQRPRRGNVPSSEHSAPASAPPAASAPVAVRSQGARRSPSPDIAAPADALDEVVERLRAGPEGGLKPGSRVGEYEIEAPLGKGGMGVVYAARHPVIAKRVAVKVLRGDYASDPEAVDRFVQEARAVNEIGHPNIVDIFAFGALPDGRPFFVMELLDGESLRQRLHRDKPLPLAEALSVLVPVCGALAAAHKAGIVHRDLKPDNVMLVRGRNGELVVKLLDFGVAKLTSGRERTRVGLVLGTPRYMAPETVRGQPVDARSDLYALGVLVYECLCGHPPYSGKTLDEIAASRAAGLMPMHLHAPGIPAAIERLVERLLDADPSRRPASATEVQIELAAQLSKAGAPTEPITEARRDEPRRGSTLPLALLGIAALGGGAYLALPHLLGRPDARPAARVDAGAPPRPDAAAPVQQLVPARVPARRPMLVVHADQPRVSFTLDGEPVGDGTGELRVELQPGRAYRVRAEARFYRPREARLKLRAGETRELSWSLQRAPRGSR